jgi:tetratricopeptide (TPR) repeat protein
VRENPGVPAFRAALANSATGLAIAQSKQKEFDAARRTIDFALEQAIELLKGGDLPLYRSISAKAHYVSAQHYADTSQFERAQADFVRAIEHWKEAIDRDPAKGEYRVWLLYSYQGRIEMLLQLNDYRGAVSAIEEYAQHWPEAQRAEFSMTAGIYMVQASWSAAKAGDILVAVQRLRQALELLKPATDQATQ